MRCELESCGFWLYRLLRISLDTCGARRDGAAKKWKEGGREERTGGLAAASGTIFPGSALRTTQAKRSAVERRPTQE